MWSSQGHKIVLEMSGSQQSDWQACQSSTLNILKHTQYTVSPVPQIFPHFSSRKPNVFWHDLKAGSSCIATEAPRAHTGMMEASGTTFLSVTTTWRAPQALNNCFWLLFELEHLLSGEMTHGSDSQIFLHCVYAGVGIAHPWEVTRCQCKLDHTTFLGKRQSGWTEPLCGFGKLGNWELLCKNSKIISSEKKNAKWE